jgi:hypothetical protein
MKVYIIIKPNTSEQELEELGEILDGTRVEYYILEHKGK